jgi:hypothetical protein
VIAKGRVGGLARGYVYVAGAFESDRASEGALAEATLRGWAGTGAEITYTAVPPGSGLRMGIDRDCDGFRDRDELDAGSDPADPLSTPTSVGPVGPGGATPVSLAQSSPNPMGPDGTSIAFTVAEPTDVSVRIYDAAGREVASLLDRSRQQGTVTLRWDGTDARGRRVASGVYFYRLDAGGATRTKRLVVVR